MADYTHSHTVANITFSGKNHTATVAERRITQLPLEVIEDPTTIERRISQAVIEVNEIPTTIERRLSQIVLEVAYLPGGDHWGWGEGGLDSWQVLN